MLSQKLWSFWYQKFPPKIPALYNDILIKYSDYYQHLNPTNKKKFLYRLYIILKRTTFIPDGIPYISKEMEILICSAIIQISFGLNKFIFSHFRKIYIAPRAYTYPGYENLRMIGDTNIERKSVSLSWPHVKTGYEVEDDAYNIALHEMAHCLKFENKFRWISKKLLNKKHLKEWKKQAAIKMEIIQKKENKLLRNYAGSNFHELFAVSVEFFFEKPSLFQQQQPDLYCSLCNLLNQNPILKSNPLLNNSKSE